ncbi:MAG: Sir2 family NAD-dependent protein deacetylase, partial [Dehalococcoidia bacterium]|nr:Sir2 family NAD-dependent protein deacetylase [Dehalococcoidia bacterium]
MEQQTGHLIDAAAELIARSKRTVAFTGAGVSTESGIPDFRSPGGIWSKFDPEDFTYQKFLADPGARRKHWELIRGSFSATARPNPAHYAIAELGRMGKLECVITQNVDDLHQRAGSQGQKVFELHGNLKWAVCLSCHERYSSDEVARWLESGVEVPDCPACHGVLKPAAVFFGESLPVAVLQAATEHARACDLMLVIGSTLTVYPAAYMPVYALESGARVIIVNLSPTPLDRDAAVLIRGKAG